MLRFWNSWNVIGFKTSCSISAKFEILSTCKNNSFHCSIFVVVQKKIFWRVFWKNSGSWYFKTLQVFRSIVAFIPNTSQQPCYFLYKHLSVAVIELVASCFHLFSESGDYAPLSFSAMLSVTWKFNWLPSRCFSTSLLVKERCFGSTVKLRVLHFPSKILIRWVQYITYFIS